MSRAHRHETPSAVSVSPIVRFAACECRSIPGFCDAVLTTNMKKNIPEVPINMNHGRGTILMLLGGSSPCQGRGLARSQQASKDSDSGSLATGGKKVQAALLVLSLHTIDMLAGTRTLTRISPGVVPSLRRSVRRAAGSLKVGDHHKAQPCAGLGASLFPGDKPWLTAIPPRRQFFAVPSMDGTVHEERRLIRYSPEDLFDVVSAVENYQEFLPWCEKSTVHHR
jgi:hypothetical protein